MRWLNGVRLLALCWITWGRIKLLGWQIRRMERCP